MKATSTGIRPRAATVRKKLRIHPRLLAEMFKTAERDGQWFRCSSGLPEDAVLIGILHRPDLNEYHFVFEAPSWGEERDLGREAETIYAHFEARQDPVDIPFPAERGGD